MPKTKSFNELTAPIAKDPVRRARVIAYKQAMSDAVDLSELRKTLNVTQSQLAERLAVTQVNVSRIENGNDLYLSTLSQYVEALGGHLELSAVFPAHTVHIDIHKAL